MIFSAAPLAFFSGHLGSCYFLEQMYGRNKCTNICILSLRYFSYDICSPPAVKQHITDEKMAEHMAQLHINSETVTSTVQPEPEPARERRLYMCEEMRKLQQESILPQSLLNRITRPCTAVVLWTPPPRIPLALQNVSENNNEDDQPDNNVMDLDAMN